MKTMYLKDGRMVDVISEDVNGKVLVAPYVDIFYESGGSPDDYEEVWDRQPSQNMIFVHKEDLTEKAPVQKYDEEITSKKGQVKELDEMISTQRSELAKLKRELDQAQKTHIANDRLVINKSDLVNADTIALFPHDNIMPMLLDKSKTRFNSFKGLKISMEIKFNGEERAWGYKLYNDDEGGYSSSVFLDKTCGILINPTQEQIDDVIRKRIATVPPDDKDLMYKFRDVPNEFLPDSVRDRREKIEENNKLAKIESLQRDVKKKEDEINQIKNSLKN